MDKSKMQIFAYDEAMVRTVDVDGKPWFVANDVANILDYRNAPDMTRNLDDDEVGTTHIVRSTSGGNPNISIISESGLYHAIFQSRKPEAQQFRKWVTSEVLPSIRRTGGYGVADGADICALLQKQISVMEEVRDFVMGRPEAGKPALSADETRATLAALSKSLAEVRRLYESGAASAEAAGGMAMGVFELMGASVHEMAIPLGGGWTDGELSASVHLFFRERVTFAGRNDAVGTRELYEEWTGMEEVPRRAFTCKVRSLYPALTYKQKRNGQDAMPQYHFFGIRLRDEITEGNVIAMPAITEADK